MPEDKNVTSFDKEPEENQEPSATEVAIQKQNPPTEVAAPGAAPGAYSSAGLGGEWDESDLKTPYLQLVQKTGKLSDEFNSGSFVFNKECVVADGKSPMRMTVLSATKYYEEDIPFDAEEIPQRFSTVAEAREAGFTKEWGASNRVKEVASLIVLVPVTQEHALFNPSDEICKEFGCEPGQGFARAMYILQGSGYTSAAKPIVTAVMAGHLRNGCHLGGWDVTSDLKSDQRNSWFVPKVRSAGLYASNAVKWLEAEVLI